MSWGRYVVSCPGTSGLPADAAEVFATIDPIEIAGQFEHLLPVLAPGELSHFLYEREALATYVLAKKHLDALLRGGCWPDEYHAARSNVARRFEETLLAVYRAATPTYCLVAADSLAFRQTLHGMHLATVSSANRMYEVTFSRNLTLECFDNVFLK